MFKSDINLNLYKTFYDVARYKNFSKTAEYTYSTQPAISKSIKKLEDELQTQLFYRKSNGVELTEKGKELLFYVEKSFGSLLTAERILLETESLDRGRLSIGMPSNMSFYVMDYIEDYNKRFPNIEITIITGTTTYLLKELEAHKIDFIIDMAPIISLNNITINKLYDSSYCFVALNSEKYKNIHNLNDLEKYQLILPIPATNNRELLDELFMRNDITIGSVMNIHTSELIKLAVYNDLGVGYILYDLVKEDIENKKLLLIDVKENLPKAEIVIAYNEQFLTKAPKKFIDLYINKGMN